MSGRDDDNYQDDVDGYLNEISLDDLERAEPDSKLGLKPNPSNRPTIKLSAGKDET